VFRRRRLLNVPGRLDHPYWTEDPDFDVDCHLCRLALPQLGNWHQFNLQLARLQSTSMDRSRPLWQAFMIEGLDGLSGIPSVSFAIVMRVHRAVADANALNDMMMQMHSLEPAAAFDAMPAELCVRENTPVAGQLLMDALNNYGRRVWQSRSLLPRSYNRMHRQLADMPELPPVSSTRFNRLPSSYRVVSHYSLDRSACEALRLYLLRKGELPAQGLVAGCPQRLTRELQGGELGEQAGVLRLGLHTDCNSPLQRLRIMQQEALAASARDPAGDFDLLNQAAEMLKSFSLAPLLLGCSLVRSVSRWGDDVTIGINACREALPDPGMYLSCFAQALEELQASVAAPQSLRVKDVANRQSVEAHSERFSCSGAKAQ
jgi:diacylglycerol O-acyltransferase